MVAALSSNFGSIGFTVLTFWLETAYSRPRLVVFEGISSPNDIIYRSSPQKAPRCAETHRLSYQAWKLVQRFKLAVCQRKKDRTVKKSYKSVTFHLLGENPHWTYLHRNLHSSCRSGPNHMYNVLNWNFQGLRFYRGSNFRFSYWFLHGPYNSVALMRCLWFHFIKIEAKIVNRVNMVFREILCGLASCYITADDWAKSANSSPLFFQVNWISDGIV